MVQEELLVPVPLCGSKTMVGREKKRSRIRTVQMMDNLRGLLGIRRMDRVLNARIRKLCGVGKGVDENIDESVLRCFDQIERMRNNMITKRVYVGECMKSCWVDQEQNRWTDAVNDCKKIKFWMLVKQRERCMTGVCERDAWGVTRGINSRP